MTKRNMISVIGFFVIACLVGTAWYLKNLQAKSLGEMKAMVEASQDLNGPRADVRPPAVAGMFYPRQPDDLKEMVDAFLDVKQAEEERLPKVLIAPHAGYIYSGAVAGTAYARLLPFKNRYKRIVLVGPAHRVPVRGVAVPEVTGFHTPLGVFPVDQAALDRVKDLPQVVIGDQPQAQEHALEVHLPFLAETVGLLPIVPLTVGAIDDPALAEVMRRLWGDEETLFVISTDLSHFEEYDAAKKHDAETIKAIMDLNPTPLHGEDACGYKGVRALLNLAREKRLDIEKLDVKNSGDTAGDKSRVVGYASFVLYEPTDNMATVDETEAEALLAKYGDALLALARESIRNGIKKRLPLSVSLDDYPEELQEDGAVFVTLEKKGQLRGCIGSVMAHRPLVEDVALHAFDAAFKDPRFSPVKERELKDLTLSLSYLTPPRAFPVEDEADLLARLRPGIDGLILRDGGHQSLYLPSVWEQLPDPKLFLQQLKLKAGLAPDHWSETISFETFTTRAVKAEFSEK